MKFKLAAAASTAMLLSSGCHAQSITVYGIVNLALERLNNVNAAGQSLVRMPTITGTVPSRIGFKGSEDLGGGARAVFALESGIMLPTGGLNNGGRLFGRFAYVGLGNEWGTVTAGRLVNMTFLSTVSENMAGNLYSIASLDNYIPNARSDNAIGYLGTFKSVTLGATYSLGRDTVTGTSPSASNCPGEVPHSRACRQGTVMLKYDNSRNRFAVSYDVMNGGPGAALGLGAANYTDDRAVLTGYGTLGAARFNAGVIHRNRHTDVVYRSNLWYAGLSYSLAMPLVLDAEIARLDIRQSANDSQMVAVRAAYYLSKRTSVYAMGGRMINRGQAAVSISAGGTVGPGMEQTGIAMGMRHDF